MPNSPKEKTPSKEKNTKTFYVSKEKYEELNLEKPVIEMFSIITDDNKVKGHIITTLE